MKLSKDHARCSLRAGWVYAAALLAIRTETTLAETRDFYHPWDLVAISLDREYSYTGGQYQDHVFHYRLFTPQPFDPQRSYPLILWLHGYGAEPGTDNTSQLEHLDATVYRNGDHDEYPFFLLVPQCPRDNRDGRWYESSESSPSAAGDGDAADDMLTVAMGIIQRLGEKYRIDEHRLTVVGISGGGSAIWELVARYPKRFAAVVPLAAGSANLSQIDRLAKTPIWAFHAERDPDTPITGVRETVEAIKRAGGTSHLTATDDQTHFCWQTAFAEHDLLHWLLAQRRDAPESPQPGSYRPTVQLAVWWDDLWPRLIGSGMVVGLIGVCLWKVKSHRRAKVRAFSSRHALQ